MGSKTAARRAALKAGVPPVPGTDEPLGVGASEAAVTAAAEHTGYPLMVKAVAGGGGKGMRVVASPDDLGSAVRAARSEAAASFGNAAIYFERRLVRPRHIEVQVLADHHGRVLPFVERECSLQRRHQKVLEETPSMAVSPELRARLAASAVAICASVGYTNAGTVEFLLDQNGHYYFLEMNTRLQVEHPITEMVTGVDLVCWQIRVARGEPVELAPEAVMTARGHALECRIYAEDPDAGFMPSPGRIRGFRVPGGPGIRDDGGAEAGGDVPIFYDPLISKLSAWGEDRPHAIARMRRALQEYEVLGIETTIGFFRWLLDEPGFLAGTCDTEYLDELLQNRHGTTFLTPDLSLLEVAAVAAAIDAADRQSLPFGSTGGRSPNRWNRGRFADGRRPELEAGWKARARLEGLRS
jgi:acetyl-CoA carboxylase biotin carboxylase subunit